MSDRARRLPGLDLLRAIAILWVMCFHAFVVGGLGPHWSWLSRYGWMGVDLFFVLSGFLIGAQVLKPLAHAQPLSFKDFYVRRAFRILPAYWAVLLLYLLWPGFREAPGMEPAWKFVAFVMNIGTDYGNAAFSHAWSLCVEEHFYLLFPVLAWALTRRPARWELAGLAGLLVAAGMASRGITWLHDARIDPAMRMRNWFIEDLYYPTWNRLDGLLAGVSLAVWKVFRPQSWARAQGHANTLLLAGIALLAAAFWLFRDRVGLLGNCVGWPVLSAGLALLVFAGAGHASVIGRWRVPGATWLAAISYSLYLVHKAAYHLVQVHWGDALAGTGILAFCVYGAAAIAAGALLHYAVERPFLRVRERLPAWRRRDERAVPTGAS